MCVPDREYENSNRSGTADEKSISGDVSVWEMVALEDKRAFGADRADDVVQTKSPAADRLVDAAHPAGSAGGAAVSKFSEKRTTMS